MELGDAGLVDVCRWKQGRSWPANLESSRVLTLVLLACWLSESTGTSDICTSSIDSVEVQGSSLAQLSQRFALRGQQAYELNPKGELSLLAVSAEGLLADASLATASSSHTAKGRRALVRRPKTAGWFGSFSEGESTLDEDGVNEQRAYSQRSVTKDGYAPTLDHPEMARLSLPWGKHAQWFVETPSGGPKEAWQTMFPALQDGARGGTPPWRTSWTDGQGFQQHYAQGPSMVLDELSKDARWFDAAVTQYDSAGRAREPGQTSARRFVDWDLRESNTTLKCGPINCTATALLQVKDPGEEHALCRLSIAVHATDFDDEFSSENVEWLSVNGNLVKRFCVPKMSGCNSSDRERILFPCVQDYDVDQLVSEEGALNIAGKVSPAVDECPVDGNLLSAIVTTKCYVRKRGGPPPQATALSRNQAAAQEAMKSLGVTAAGEFMSKMEDDLAMQGLLYNGKVPAEAMQLYLKAHNREDVHPEDFDLNGDGFISRLELEVALIGDEANSTTVVNFTRAIRCAVPGCIANLTMRISQQAAPRNCSLTIRVWQTDYDGDQNADEEIEFIEVRGATTSMHVKPGKNRCKAITSNETEDTYVALLEEDVTERIAGGILPVAMKISPMVDECGYEGMLLAGRATLICKPA
mmetsp:Transcript_56937/g.123215  ORF Transcript_56937/g.123215 Transcript_56937/m.123215 type:complete len:640 (-) Transcript_56937:166-2085(-)